MITNDFILARNSGTTPVSVLFDKSLKDYFQNKVKVNKFTSIDKPTIYNGHTYSFSSCVRF